MLLVSITQLKLVLKGCPTKIGDRLERDGGRGAEQNVSVAAKRRPGADSFNHFRQIIWQLSISSSSLCAASPVPSPSTCTQVTRLFQCNHFNPATVLASRNFARSRPFSLQQFLIEQSRPRLATMSDMEKKARLSGESPRVSEPSNILPTVNVATEKPEPPKASLHPSIYVMYAA